MGLVYMDAHKSSVNVLLMPTNRVLTKVYSSTKKSKGYRNVTMVVIFMHLHCLTLHLL